MPSKRSRAWHRRKLGDRAAARLGASGIAYDTGRTSSSVRVTITAGGQTLELTDVRSFTYQQQPERRRVETMPTVELRGELTSDSADALFYAMEQERLMAEAAQRLDGTYQEPIPLVKSNWEMGSWGAASPFPAPPRLDGRRRKR